MSLTTEQQSLVEQRLTNEKKSTATAYILWFFLGGISAHRFYLGKTGTAIAQLALFVVGLLTLAIAIGIALLVVWFIWIIVDAFLIPGLIEKDMRSKRQAIATEIATTGTIM